MNDYQRASQVMREVHVALLSWAGGLLSSADLSLSVGDRLDQAPDVLLLPTELGPWPRMVESNPDISLLNSAERAPMVPPLWIELGALVAESLQQWPRGKSPLWPIDEMPAPLSAWYAGQPAWRVEQEQRSFGRPPALAWRRPLLVQTNYLALASADPLPALGVLTLGLQKDPVLRVQIPPFELPPGLATWLTAIAQARGGAAEVRLMELLDQLQGRSELRVTLQPVTEVAIRDVAEVMRALGRPLQPMVHLMVRVPLGGGPIFEASVSANIRTGRG